MPTSRRHNFGPAHRRGPRPTPHQRPAGGENPAAQWLEPHAGRHGAALGDLPLNMQLAPDGKMLAVTNNGQSTQTIQLIDPQTEKLLDERVIGKSVVRAGVQRAGRSSCTPQAATTTSFWPTPRSGASSARPIRCASAGPGRRPKSAPLAWPWMRPSSASTW
ncbi:MAG: hypothetical protein WKG07_49410 [Hymenobacter sp.]